AVAVAVSVAVVSVSLPQALNINKVDKIQNNLLHIGKLAF
ncbi:MAG: hypothetical protein ACI845_002070, partial [Gammaproteobacteria bacterium]